MPNTAIEHFILEQTGLNPESLGSKNIERAVADAMARTGIRDLNDYLARLKSSASELESLIDDLVVTETWFFRDHEPFVFLKHHVQSSWLPSHPTHPLRILSAPCSTGEEPYSIAMTLLDAGLAREQFRIVAVDISSRAIGTARRATYHDRAFRGQAADKLDAYFHPTPGGRVLDERVARLVNFHVDNLVHPSFLLTQGQFDVVFCRNMIIYFSDAPRTLILNNLNHLLVPHGILITGHSELPFFLQAGYTPVPHARSFACFHGKPAERLKSHRIPSPAPADRSKHVPAGPALSSLSRPAEIAPQVAPDRDQPQHVLAAIRRLADQGALAKAGALCEQFLKEHPPSSEAYCLLGLIHQASDRLDAAEASYIKALYLNPNCVEALVHLRLCYERRGDTVKAGLIRDRAKRMEMTEQQPA